MSYATSASALENDFASDLLPERKPSPQAMLPVQRDINKTDKSYKERLAMEAMANNISRGLASSVSGRHSPAGSLPGADLDRREKESHLHLIMLVGLLASGKTTLARSIVKAFGGYVLVSGECEEDDSWKGEWDKW